METEQFYKKPKDQAELNENMKILKEIPEDASDPKVIIKLGNPDRSHKFVFMEDEDGRKYIVALPIDKKSMHAEIVNFCRKLYKKDIHALGGGYIHTEGDTLIIDGTSESYGEAPKKVIAEILQKKFPNMKIESNSLMDMRIKIKEKEYQDALATLDTTVQRELYAAVCDGQSIKLGSDYASRPRNIEGSNDLAYMVYSSENGSSFGFDTLYIGYKNKSGEIKSKEVIRERGYINIDKIQIENSDIVIRYTADARSKVIKISIDNIEKFEMISNIDEIGQQLIKMYQDNQFFHTTDISHF